MYFIKHNEELFVYNGWFEKNLIYQLNVTEILHVLLKLFSWYGILSVICM